MCELWVSKDKTTEAEADLLVGFVNSVKKQGQLKEWDQATDGVLLRLAEAQEFEGKKGQTLSTPVWDGMAANHLLLMGVGDAPFDEPGTWIKLGATLARAAARLHAGEVAVALPPKMGDFPKMAGGLLLGARLARYQFTTHKSDKGSQTSLSAIGFVMPTRTAADVVEEVEEHMLHAQMLAEGICAARDLVNAPPNILTPTEFADRAELLAETYDMECTILDKEQLQAKGLNLLLAVASGSVQEPRLIHLTYKPAGKRKKRKKICLIGKGVTFDSGGLSIKSTAGMLNMHADMGGGAAVFGAMQVIAQMEPDVEVHGIIAATENMTGAAAYKLNDVIESYSGKTVEIRNTDAEGRLALADALHYASELAPDQIIDLATLTGACMVALGRHTAALMCNHEGMADKLREAAKEANESIWELPLLETLRDSLKSPVADISNIGDRYGGAISAALFLREFVGDNIQWAHFDIAGPAFSDKDAGHITRGGTGFAVATLSEYVRSLS